MAITAKDGIRLDNATTLGYADMLDRIDLSSAFLENYEAVWNRVGTANTSTDEWTGAKQLVDTYRLENTIGVLDTFNIALLCLQTSIYNTRNTSLSWTKRTMPMRPRSLRACTVKQARKLTASMPPCAMCPWREPGGCFQLL
jgi:hypothetical protein